MADVIIKILEPATSFALLSLEELKVMLSIPSTDITGDPQLQLMIDWYSAEVSALTNRVFARERVRETWRELQSRRVFLSHWPVKEEDIESVEAPRGTLPRTDWELEERSGKLSLFGSQAEPIVVIYRGGFDLPDDADNALKNATAIFVRKGRTETQRDATSGIRSISHKESRVMFFDPNQSSGGGSGAGGTGTEAIRAAHALLRPYIRLEV